MSLLKELFTQQHIAENITDEKITAVGGKAKLYKRSSSSCWQMRFKLSNGKWLTQTSGSI
jgi:hypothetical protein